MTPNPIQPPDLIINGKSYPLWSQFVHRAAEWVGGTLEDREYGESMTTTITGIELTPNGDDSAFFAVVGTDFTCGFDVAYGGIEGGDEDWTTFSGYGGHSWRIKKP